MILLEGREVRAGFLDVKVGHDECGGQQEYDVSGSLVMPLALPMLGLELGMLEME